MALLAESDDYHTCTSEICMVKWRFHEKDVQFLRDVGVMDTKLVAVKYGITTKGVSNRIHRIALRLDKSQNYVNALRSLQKENARVRKKTTLGNIPERLKTESFLAEDEIRSAHE